MESDLEGLRQSLRQLLQEGQFAEAATRSQEFVRQYPDDAAITMLAGISLEQTGRIDEATPLLRRATVLDPTDPETFHNLAISLYNQGDLLEAEEYAREALKLDPEHERALATLAKCQAEKGQVAFEANGVEIPASEETIRRGLDDAPNYIWNLGLPWTRIGFGLVAYCIFSFAFLIFHPFMDVNQVMRKDPAAIVAFILYITSGLACVFWMLVDIIDRREKFVWLLPMWVCGIAALPVLPLALYLAVGRKVVQLN